MVEDDSQAEKLSNRPWQGLGLGAVRRVGTCRTVVEEKALRPSGFSRRRCQRRFSGKPSERHWFLLVFAVYWQLSINGTVHHSALLHFFLKHFTSFFFFFFFPDFRYFLVCDTAVNTQLEIHVGQSWSNTPNGPHRITVCHSTTVPAGVQWSKWGEDSGTQHKAHHTTNKG